MFCHADWRNAESLETQRRTETYAYLLWLFSSYLFIWYTFFEAFLRSLISRMNVCDGEEVRPEIWGISRFSFYFHSLIESLEFRIIKGNYPCQHFVPLKSLPLQTNLSSLFFPSEIWSSEWHFPCISIGMGQIHMDFFCLHILLVIL